MTRATYSANMLGHFRWRVRPLRTGPRHYLASRRYLLFRTCWVWLCLSLLPGLACAFSAYDLPAMDGGPPPRPLKASRGVRTPLPQRKLSLLDLTDLALRNNPQTRVAWAQVRMDAAALGIERAAYWPTLAASLSVSRLQSLSASGTSSPAQNRYGAAISLSYLLWDFGSRAGNTRAAKYVLLGSRLADNQTLQNVILQVEQFYYQVQGYSALVKADEQSLSNAKRSLSAAQKRRELGLATVGDVYQARTAVAQARLSLQQSRGALASARGSLVSTVGYPADDDLALMPWSHRNVTPPKMPVHQLLARARAARPELLQAKAQEMASLARIRATRAEGLPSISLNAQAGRTWISGGDIDGARDSYSVGATLTIPIFSGYADEYALAQAKAGADQANANTDFLLRQVELEVWHAYQDVQTSATTLQTSNTLVDNAALAEKVVRARYEHGFDTILNLLTAQSTLASARATRVQDQVNYYSALAVLGHAAGGLPDSVRTAQ